MLSFSFFLLVGFIVSEIFELSTKKWALWDKRIGWQFHHSLFGLVLFALIPVFPEQWISLLGSGLGVIVQHTISDGLVFIRKW